MRKGTLKDRKSSEELRKRLGIVSVSSMVSRGRLRWFGHVERKNVDDWVSACRKLECTRVQCSAPCCSLLPWRPSLLSFV